jgi:hypothetical protein
MTYILVVQTEHSIKGLKSRKGSDGSSTATCNFPIKIGLKMCQHFVIFLVYKFIFQLSTSV